MRPLWSIPYFFNTSYIDSLGSVVGTVASLQAGRSEVRIPVAARYFLSSPECPDRLWAPPSHLFNGYPSSFPEREVNHPPPCSAEVKNEWSYTSATQRDFIAWTVILSSLLFPSRQPLGLSNSSAPFVFCDWNFEIISHFSHVRYTPLPSHPPYAHRETQITKPLDIQISIPSTVFPLTSKHKKHTVFKILQRQIQMIPSKTSTNHNSKLQYIVIYIIIQPSENLGNVKLASQICHSDTVCLQS